MKNKSTAICLVIGLFIIILSTNIGVLLANINADGTTEMQFCTYIDNFSASIRIIGLIITFLPVLRTHFFKQK